MRDESRRDSRCDLVGVEEVAQMDRAGEEEDAGHGRQREKESVDHHAERGRHGGRPTVRIFSVTLMRG